MTTDPFATEEARTVQAYGAWNRSMKTLRMKVEEEMVPPIIKNVSRPCISQTS